MIVVVSGLPRSGTSMVMQMLGAGGIELLSDDRRRADEGNPRGYCEYEPVRNLARDSSWIAEAEGKVVKVIIQLLKYLPASRSYRVVLLERDLDEVLASQTRMLIRLGKPTRDVTLLRQAFAAQVTQIKEWLSSQPHMEALVVGYHEILAHPGLHAEGLARFAGTDLNIDAMVAAVDPNLYRERHTCGV